MIFLVEIRRVARRHISFCSIAIFITASLCLVAVYCTVVIILQDIEAISSSYKSTDESRIRTVSKSGFKAVIFKCNWSYR